MTTKPPSVASSGANRVVMNEWLTGQMYPVSCAGSTLCGGADLASGLRGVGATDAVVPGTAVAPSDCGAPDCPAFDGALSSGATALAVGTLATAVDCGGGVFGTPINTSHMAPRR